MNDTANSHTFHLLESEVGKSLSEPSRMEAEHIFKQLLDYSQSTGDGLDAVEAQLFGLLLRLGQALLQLNVDRRAEQEPRREVISKTGESLPYHSQSCFSYRSVFGDVKVTRAYYWCKGQAGQAPADEALQRPERCYSYLLEQWALRLGVVEPFEGSVNWLAEQLGVQVPKRSLEQLAQEAARDVDDFYQQVQTAPEASADECVVISLDGKGVPIVKAELAEKRSRLKRGEKAQHKKMALIASLYTVKATDRSVALEAEQLPDIPAQDKQAFAELTSKQSFASYLSARASERGAGKRPTAFVADGQPALWKLKQQICPQAVEILDFQHVREYLWKAAYSFLPEGSQQAQAWVRQQEGRLLQGKPGKVIGGLRLRLAKGTIRGARNIKAVRQVINYLHNNRTRMHYDQYLKAGFPIGSGAVESSCKQLVVTRMEGSGMRWSMAGAQAMLKLRSVYLNGDWQRYWAFHRQQQQSRLYGSRSQIAEPYRTEKMAA
jgi:hypothetical protein